ARQPHSLRRRSAAAAGGDRPEPNLAGFGPFIHGLRPRTRARGRRADRTDGAALLEPAAARRSAAGTDRIGAVALLGRAALCAPGPARCTGAALPADGGRRAGL